MYQTLHIVSVQDGSVKLAYTDPVFPDWINYVASSSHFLVAAGDSFTLKLAKTSKIAAAAASANVNIPLEKRPKPDPSVWTNIVEQHSKSPDFNPKGLAAYAHTANLTAAVSDEDLFVEGDVGDHPLILSGGNDNCVRVWSASGKLLSSLEFDSWVTTVSFCRDLLTTKTSFVCGTQSGLLALCAMAIERETEQIVPLHCLPVFVENCRAEDMWIREVVLEHPTSSESGEVDNETHALQPRFAAKASAATPVRKGAAGASAEGSGLAQDVGGTGTGSGTLKEFGQKLSARVGNDSSMTVWCGACGECGDHSAGSSGAGVSNEFVDVVGVATGHSKMLYAYGVCGNRLQKIGFFPASGVFGSADGVGGQGVWGMGENPSDGGREGSLPVRTSKLMIGDQGGELYELDVVLGS